MDKVSIVITTYKRKEEFKKALLSALSQTYCNVEIIVIDDNREESYSNYIKSLLSEYNTVKYHKNDHNLGGALSRNEGLKIATGKYIAFLDDDDEYLPQKIEMQVKCFESTNLDNVGIVYCHTIAVDENENVLAIYDKTVRGDFLVKCMKETIAATTQWLCLKNAVEFVGGFKDVPSKQDTTLLIDLALNGFQIDVVPKVLSKYYELDIERISGRGEKNLKGELILREYMRNYYDSLSDKDIREIEFNITQRICELQYKTGNYLDAKRSFKYLLSLRVNSKQIIYRAIKQLIKSVLFSSRVNKCSKNKT